MAVTRQQAEEMRDAIKQLEEGEVVAAKVINDANIQVAVDWWDTIKPAVPRTRDEALAAYQFIEGLLQTETDNYRLVLLRQKLRDANEKYRERKRNG